MLVGWFLGWAIALLPLIEREGLRCFRKRRCACFVIADISGYTHFVSGVELDHAQDIIADIMDTLVRACVRRSASPSSKATPPSSTRSPTRWMDRSCRIDRTGLFCLPQAAPQHQAGELLRVPGLQPDAEP